MNYNKIMFAGPSGFGKTTLAKWLSEQSGVPFKSGSVSDLIPQTREVAHKDMLARDPKELYTEDFQILNLRNKLFFDKDQYVSDRSYLDSAAYFLYKQGDNQPACEVEHFFGLCSMLLAHQCDCLIFLNFIPELVSEWVTEDNNKRITSNYFQVEISSIMKTALTLLGYKSSSKVYYITKQVYKGISGKLLPKRIYLDYGAEVGYINNLYGKTKVIIINEPNLQVRKDLLKEFVL